MSSLFAKTLDRIGKGEKEDTNEKRRQITLDSFRRFVKSTISDLGYSDYSEWFMDILVPHTIGKKNQKRLRYLEKLNRNLHS